MVTQQLRYITVPLVLAGSLASAQTLEVDWLYLTNSGSWLQRSETLKSEQTNLRLPVEHLSLDQLWWQSSAADTRLTWSQPDPMGLPQQGATIEIIGEPGLWLIQEVNANHLVLQQGKNIRYWPQSQWHQLSWTTTSDFGMALTVHQPSQTKNQFFYAWQTADISAQVRYRLENSQDAAYLHQELIVSNLTDADYSAPGYSFAQIANPPVAMMRSVVMESQVASFSAPQASQSQGVPTLVSNSPLTLTAGSHVWLPVSSTELSSVEQHYQLQWDTRSTHAQQAQSRLHIQSVSALPDIAGAIKVGVFDQQIPLLNSHYQPKSQTEAELSLGQSALVSAQGKQLSTDRWQLEVVNRSNDVAEVMLTVNHWLGKTNQSIPLTFDVPARDSTRFVFEAKADGQLMLVP